MMLIVLDAVDVCLLMMMHDGWMDGWSDRLMCLCCRLFFW